NLFRLSLRSCRSTPAAILRFFSSKLSTRGSGLAKGSAGSAAAGAGRVMLCGAASADAGGASRRAAAGGGAGRMGLAETAGGAADGGGIGGGRRQRDVARHRAEVGITQLDAHRAAGVALARQIVRHLLA